MTTRAGGRLFSLQEGAAMVACLTALGAVSLPAMAAPPSGGAAPEPGPPIEDGLADLDLGSLLQIDEVSVASLKTTGVRQAPGIVSVLTHDDIEASGARDLVDLFEMLPGFFVGVDVQGNLGLGIRGNWGQEGKILLLIDGQEINETAYGTVSIGHHFPVQAIERIEIIRGPGSAIYGGFAELGVVKVSTRGAEQIEGVEALQRGGVAIGRNGTDVAHPFVDTYVAAGRSLGDFELSLSLFGGYSVQSEGRYTDIFGASFDAAAASARRPLLANLQAAWRDWQLRFIADGFTYQAQDDFDVAGSAPTHYRFGGIYVDLTTVFELVRGLTLTPRLAYKIQESYVTLPTSSADAQRIVDAGLLERLRMDRALAGMTLSWDPHPSVNAIAGVEAFLDVGRAGGSPGDGSTVQGTRSVSTVAGFGQVLWSTPLANLTLGGRGEHHSYFGWSVVPRAALTRVFASGLHVKLLGSHAYKSPTFMNYALERAIDPANRVQPERTTAVEAEIGYALPSGLQLVVNGFYCTIDRPIIYGYDQATDEESYFNRGRTGTYGGEAELRLGIRNLAVSSSYSYYHALANIPEDYRASGDGATLGAPQHKGAVRARWRPTSHWLLGATAIWMGSRYAVTGMNTADQTYIVTAVGPRLLLGLSARYQDLGLRGLSLGLVANDLLDSRDVFVQPYRGGHAPLPGVGRQVLLSLGYAWER
jgi:outer membrane receptor protein involved in Fe transport